MSAEDLTIQAGLALQQDLALVSLLGITHVERNGHHYVNGMAALGAGEQQAFLDAHPDLYERSHGAVRRAHRRRRAGHRLAAPRPRLRQRRGAGLAGDALDVHAWLMAARGCGLSCLCTETCARSSR